MFISDPWILDLDFFHPGSRIPDLGVKMHRIPDPQHCFLLYLPPVMRPSDKGLRSCACVYLLLLGLLLGLDLLLTARHFAVCFLGCEGLIKFSSETISFYIHLIEN
jgi:hypothetical protein